MEISEVKNRIIEGDCIEVMEQFPENSFSVIITDPPYGLKFMDKEWDSFKLRQKTSNQLITWLGSGMAFNKSELKAYQEFTFEWAKVAIRILKPGGYLLAFGGSRTFHRMYCGIEDAGFEIKDTIMWLYGSGFPKGLNIAKAIQNYKQTGKATATGTGDGGLNPLGYIKRNFELGYRKKEYTNQNQDVYEITDEDALRWLGWNTALKPAFEPIVVARKPISEENLVKNILKYGTGGINIEAGRIPINEVIIRKFKDNKPKSSIIIKSLNNQYYENDKGRYPANVILECICDEIVDGKHTNPECPCYLLDKQTGELESGYMSPLLHKREKTKGEYQSPSGIYGKFDNQYLLETYGDKGGASRFFYCAKASVQEREMGLGDGTKRKNLHPTVKPVALMKYLVKMFTPPGGIVLDPFAGSGSTLIACKELGISFVGIEKEKEYVEIAQKRLNAVLDRIEGL